MKKFQKLILPAFFILLLSGCTASGPKFSGLATPVSDKCDVYLYRTNALFAAAQSFAVKLDGKKVADLYNASFVHFQLPPGEHVLRVSPGGFAKDSEIRTNLVIGETYFYQYTFDSGPFANVFFAGSSILPKSKEDALIDLKELKAAQ